MCIVGKWDKQTHTHTQQGTWFIDIYVSESPDPSKTPQQKSVNPLL